MNTLNRIVLIKFSYLIDYSLIPINVSSHFHFPLKLLIPSSCPGKISLLQNCIPSIKEIF